jgi:uncharacterized damage-inducible protein DinB
MALSIPASDLLRWNDLSAAQWRDFLNAHPEVLALACDIRGTQNVAQLMQHIVAVELRYAQRLAAQPESEYADVAYGSADVLFATHMRAMEMLRTLLADDAFDWDAEIEFTTISAGRIRASRRVILVHLLMHSIRHYAQLATLARSHGCKPDFSMDYLFTTAQPA